jgi:hypothetical protein
MIPGFVKEKWRFKALEQNNAKRTRTESGVKLYGEA